MRRGSFLQNETAELYDPGDGKWELTASMHEGRALATATLLPNGQALVAGGFNNCDDDFCFDLNEGGALRLRQRNLDDDRLFSGGSGTAGCNTFEQWLGLDSRRVQRGETGTPRLSSAAIYDPSTGTWTPTAPMPAAHYGQIADLLGNGWVLEAGGQSNFGGGLRASAEDLG